MSTFAEQLDELIKDTVGDLVDDKISEASEDFHTGISDEIENVKYNKRVKDLIISALGAISFLFKLLLPCIKLVHSKVLNSTNKICDKLILQQVEPILNKQFKINNTI